MPASVAKGLAAIVLCLASATAVAGEPMFDESCMARGQSRADVERFILEAATRYDIDPDLLWAKAKVESNLHPCIVSKAGAIGVMQLMPVTALELGVTDPFDAEQNIDAGARFLAKLIEKFRTPAMYLAAYNAGYGAVLRKRHVPNYPETRRHIRKVLRAYQQRRGMDDDFAAVQALTYSL